MRTLLLVIVLVAAPAALTAQGRRTDPDSGWVVRSNAGLDLWYHGMALAGLYDTTARLPLYNPRYVALMRRVRAEHGVRTLLDSLAPQLARDFQRLDQQSLFHFMPLQFPPMPAESLLASLRQASERRLAQPPTSGRQRSQREQQRSLGVALMSLQLQNRRTRQFLEEFVRALQSEWELFYATYWQQAQQLRMDSYAEINDMWRDQLDVPLKQFLSRVDLQAGVIYPSAALGFEGRLEPGDPDDPTDNKVAVWFPPQEDGADYATFAVLRELCFVVVDQVMAGAERNNRELDELRGKTAVRCGELLLEFYAPTLLARYRRTYLAAGGRASAESPGHAFAEMYAIPEDVYARLRAAVRRGG